jgi:HD-GYP domain-containing protein (c-di-GMP phosphodiesterase class II)
MLNGGGYPRLHYRRDCMVASRLVHVCDVYDALCTTRPYRAAWTPDQAASYLRERAGVEFDPDLVDAFLGMLGGSEVDLRVLADQPAHREAIRSDTLLVDIRTEPLLGDPATPDRAA